MHQTLTRTALTLISVAGIGSIAVQACSSESNDGSKIGGGDNYVNSYHEDAAPPVATNGPPEGMMFNTGGTGSGGSGSGTLGSGGTCAGVGASAEPLPVDMYIMLDKSSSMADPLGNASSKWDATVQAIQSFVTSDRAAGIGVGIQFFGLPDACNADQYAVPAVPIGRLPAVAQDISNAVAAEGPATLTPTAPALEGALKYMQSWHSLNPDRAAVVVLATDGFPTQCGVSCTAGTDCQSGTCTNGMCDPNSITEIQALAERYSQADPPVLTFVVGVAEGLANLDNIAKGGGTGSAFLIDGGDVKTEFLNAMLSISSTPLSCQFDMPVPDDPNMTVDPKLVSVNYRDAATQTSAQIVKLAGASQCAINKGEGWYYDYDAEPTQIFICPESCKKFAAGSVEILLGCKPEEVPLH